MYLIITLSGGLRWYEYINNFVNQANGIIVFLKKNLDWPLKAKRLFNSLLKHLINNFNIGLLHEPNGASLAVTVGISGGGVSLGAWD